MPVENFGWGSPYQRLFGRVPSYLELQTIGCLCYTPILDKKIDKMDEKGHKCILLGYPHNQNGYKL